MANNFKCPDCGKEHFISWFSFRTNGKCYDKSGRLLICDCEKKEELSFIEKPLNGVPMIGSNRKDQFELIKKRSKEHFKKEIKEKKEFMDRQKKYRV